MYSQTGRRVQFLVAYVTFEVFGFLVPYKDLLVVEFSIAVPVGERLRFLINAHPQYTKLK